jgi:nickel-dependent lactate racemase
MSSSRSLRLRHGTKTVELTVPDSAPVREFGIRHDLPAAPDLEAALRRALDPLRARDGEFVRAAAGRRLALLVDDATRSEPHETLVAAALELFHEVGAAHVTLFVCTGTHEPTLKENVELASSLRRVVASSPLASRVEVVVHDCRAPPVDCGVTSRGTRVLVNEKSARADVFLALSDMKNHYFAGYSNPVKGLVPGIAAFETARGNHAHALDSASTFGHHPWHPDPARRDHPLAADMVEAAKLVLRGRPAFALCLFTRSKRELLWADSGPMSEVAGRGMRFVDAATSVTVAPARRVVVTAGGHPFDESLYTAQRALELTKNAVEPGGEILFLAACANGIGPAESIRGFYDRLKPDLDQVLHSFEGEYEMYSHKTYKFARMLKDVAAIRVVSELSREALESVHLAKEERPQVVLDRWLAEDPTAPILVFHDASKLAVHADRSARRPTPVG